MKKILTVLIIIALIILGISFVKISQSKKAKSESNIYSKTTSEENKNSSNVEKIKEISQNLGYNNVNTEMYDVITEYDGRQTIGIKPNIQYNVAMAGAIKNNMPEFSEIDKLLKEAPYKNGIWIEKNSREKFLKILEEATFGKYKIDNEGFLIQEQTKNSNEIDNVIKKIINSKKTYSFKISSITYLVDQVTGNIEEYPFEEIDPEQPYELFEKENATLYVITENKSNKLKYKDIIEEIFNNIEI